jgi:hypothetical protein
MLVTGETFRFICDSSHENNHMISDNKRSIKVIRLRSPRSYSVEYSRLGLTSECWPSYDNWTKLKMTAIEWHCSHFSILIVADVLINLVNTRCYPSVNFTRQTISHGLHDANIQLRANSKIDVTLIILSSSHTAILLLFSTEFSESLPINTTDLTLFSHVIENMQSIIIIRGITKLQSDNFMLWDWL